MPFDQSDDAEREYRRWYNRHYMRAWRRGKAAAAEEAQRERVRGINREWMRAYRAGTLKRVGQGVNKADLAASQTSEGARRAAKARWAGKRKLKPRRP